MLPESTQIRTYLSHNRPAKTQQFLRLLKSAGTQVTKGRGKGGHVLFSLNGMATTVAQHGDTDYDPVFLDDICKQLKTRRKNIQK